MSLNYPCETVAGLLQQLKIILQECLETSAREQITYNPKCWTPSCCHFH